MLHTIWHTNHSYNLQTPKVTRTIIILDEILTVKSSMDYTKYTLESRCSTPSNFVHMQPFCTFWTSVSERNETPKCSETPKSGPEEKAA